MTRAGNAAIFPPNAETEESPMGCPLSSDRGCCAGEPSSGAVATRVKICGLMRPEDADAVNAAGADFAGFILSPGFRRSIAREQAAELSARLDAAVTPVGVFVDEPVEFVASFVAEGTIRAVQLHGQEDDAYIAALRQRIPDTPIAKAFKVRSEADVAQANASAADVVLLDNGQGTGKTFDWTALAAATRPYILAGGLAPENVAAAIHQLHPYAVDMSSGVETDGSKDPHKITQAVKQARAANTSASNPERKQVDSIITSQRGSDTPEDNATPTPPENGALGGGGPGAGKAE